MNILKKFLRGLFYFCVGVKAAFHDLIEWYTSNEHLPRFLRNRASLLVLVLAVVAGGWGLVAALGNLSAGPRQVPAIASSSSPRLEKPASKPESAPEPASSGEEPVKEADKEPEPSEPEASAPSEDASSEPEIDAMASATKFTPIGAEQLRSVLRERAKAYYEHPVFTPPAAGDIAGWQAVNPDVRAWITIPNTNISWPVVIGPYTDYYTHLGYYKEPSRNGVIWFDSDVKFDATGEITSRNAVIYGHNWTNCWRPVRVGNPADVMFAQLAAYDNADFAAQNPYIRIATPGGDHLYQVFTVFYTDLSFVYVYCDGPQVGSIINTAKAKSIHSFNVPVGANDQIITLSTCTRVLGAGDNQRFVVMAKKIS